MCLRLDVAIHHALRRVLDRWGPAPRGADDPRGADAKQREPALR